MYSKDGAAGNFFGPSYSVTALSKYRYVTDICADHVFGTEMSD